MSQASQKYIHEMQRITLLVSFLLALLLNVDALYMVRVLWEDSSLRNTATSVAPQLMTDLDNQIDLTQGAGASRLGEVQENVGTGQDTLENLLELRLPIGWLIQPTTGETSDELSINADRLESRNLWQLYPVNNPDGWLSLWVLKFIGILLTTFVLTLGAPFWFSLMRKLSKRDGT